MEQNSEVAVKAENIPIFKLESSLRKLPQVEVPLFHDFCTGIYARTILMKAGTVAVGAVHKNECFFLVRSGSLLITTDKEPVKAESGFMIKTLAGSKRAAYALVDTLITTFHANPEELREPEELWNNFTVPPDEIILEALERSKLEGV